MLRQDIQWQVLDHIFADRSFRFTAPVDSASLPLRLAFRLFRVADRPAMMPHTSQKSPPAPPIYVNFDQLFLEAILSSLKTTQNVRSKLIANPEFAMNYCKICLLINVGRFNTTLACASRGVAGLLCPPRARFGLTPSKHTHTHSLSQHAHGTSDVSPRPVAPD